MKSKDERSWDIGPEAKVASLRFRDYSSDRSVAIIQRPPDDSPQCGSATCVQLGARWFLATAAHNIEHVGVDAELCLLPRGERSHDGIPFIRRSHPRAVSYPHDVAWLEVDVSTARKGGLLAVPSEQLEPKHQIPGAYFIQGYPSGEVNTNAAGGFDPLSLAVAVISVMPTNARAALGLEYPPASEADAGLQLVHPRGFSGGGAWTFNFIDVWPFINVERESLVGIVTEYHAGKGTLNVVSIEAWLNLVLEDNPELRC